MLTVGTQAAASQRTRTAREEVPYRRNFQLLAQLIRSYLDSLIRLCLIRRTRTRRPAHTLEHIRSLNYQSCAPSIKANFVCGTTSFSSDFHRMMYHRSSGQRLEVRKLPARAQTTEPSIENSPTFLGLRSRCVFTHLEPALARGVALAT